MKHLKNSIHPIFSSVVVFFFLLFLLFTFPHSARSSSSLAEDLIAREGWRKISLDFDGAQLLDILKLFSQQSGLNFVASPDVSSTNVTLYFENVPLREALEKILNANQLTYELDEGSNIFVVKKLVRPEVNLITKVYHLKYAQVSRSPLNLGSGGGRGTSGTGTSGRGTAGSAGLVNTIQERLSTYGTMTEDTRTNSLIISDVPVYLNEIEMAIRELDVPIPQVIIKVEIIDTSKNLVDNLGFSWVSAGSLFTFTLPSHRFPSTSPLHTGGSSPLSAFFGGPNAGPLSLSLLRTHSDTRILARPKILTLSNERAEIKIAGKEVVATTETLDDTGQIQDLTPQYESDIGVKLIVTPSANLTTGEITMLLEPSIKSTEDSAFVDARSNVFKNVNERSAKVKLVARNNETIVLGGLLRHELAETKTKVPFLGDIPLLGVFFRHKNKTKDQDRELLIFITPRIVGSSSGDFVQTVQLGANFDQEIFVQREQADYSYRKEEIDKELRNWDN